MSSAPRSSRRRRVSRALGTATLAVLAACGLAAGTATGEVLLDEQFEGARLLEAGWQVEGNIETRADARAHFNGVAALADAESGDTWSLARTFEPVSRSSRAPVVIVEARIRIDAPGSGGGARILLGPRDAPVAEVQIDSPRHPGVSMLVSSHPPDRGDRRRVPVVERVEPHQWLRLILTANLASQLVDLQVWDEQDRHLGGLPGRAFLLHPTEALGALHIASFEGRGTPAALSIDEVVVHRSARVDDSRFGGFEALCADFARDTYHVPQADVATADCEHLPLGWERIPTYSGARAAALEDAQLAAQIRLDTDTPRSGGGALQLTLPARQPPIHLRESAPRPVVPGAPYRLTYFYRIESQAAVGALVIYAQPVFLDATGKELERGPSVRGGRRRSGSPWRIAERDFVVPSGAATAYIQIWLEVPSRFRTALERRIADDGIAGRISIDDLGLFRLPEAALTDDPSTGAPLRAYALGSSRGHAPAGFTTVANDRRYAANGDDGHGWLLADAHPKLLPYQLYDPGVQEARAAAHYPTLLQGSGVRKATFGIELPDGPYRVSVFMGALIRGNFARASHELQVGGDRVEGTLQIDLDTYMDTEYFRHVSDGGITGHSIRRAGDAIHERVIAPRFRRYDFDARATRGRLEIESLEGYMNAIVVSPLDRRGEHDAAMVDLSAQLRHEFVVNWARPLPTSPLRGAHRGDFEPSPDDAYVIYQRPWMEAVEHDSRPSDTDRLDVLELAGTPGEIEPVTFSIWPRRDLRDVRIEISDLVRGEGDGAAAHVPASAIRILALENASARLSRSARYYHIEGSYLPEWHQAGGRDLHRDIVQRSWLSVQIPPSTPAGTYEGSVRIVPRADEAETETLRLRLRVYDFALERPAGLYAIRRGGHNVHVPYPNTYGEGGATPRSAERYAAIETAPDAVRTRQLYYKQALDDLARQGFQPELSPYWRRHFDPETGQIDWMGDTPDPPARVAQILADSPFGASREILVDGAPLSHDILAAFNESTKNPTWTRQTVADWLTALCRDLGPKSPYDFGGYARVLVHATAEESHYESTPAQWQSWLAFLRFVHEGDARTGIDPHTWGNDPADRERSCIHTVHTFNTHTAHQEVVPLGLVDRPMLGIFHGGDEIDHLMGQGADLVAAARRAGRPYGLYGIRGRFVAGLYLWAIGGSGTYHEFYAPYYGQPANPWDGPLERSRPNVPPTTIFNEIPGWTVATYSRSGPMVSTWFWEELREGRDDHAYLHTLERWLEKTAGSHDVSVRLAADEGRRRLTDLRRSISLDLDFSKFLDVRHGLPLYRPFDPQQHRRTRRGIAEATEQLVRAARAAPGDEAGP